MEKKKNRCGGLCPRRMELLKVTGTDSRALNTLKRKRRFQKKLGKTAAGPPVSRTLTFCTVLGLTHFLEYVRDNQFPKGVPRCSCPILI